ncbi:unnamed protein product [Cuscuta epithymum]|uniref:Uncharacterized protein n=1 Tax=Cuscuta epithymum TaxID=186058 RepID=A0AAV0D9D1_9ASTE|nr:unnamed protein product [Cuscuta epithymum]
MVEPPLISDIALDASDSTSIKSHPFSFTQPRASRIPTNSASHGDSRPIHGLEAPAIKTPASFWSSQPSPIPSSLTAASTSNFSLPGKGLFQEFAVAATLVYCSRPYCCAKPQPSTKN